MFVTAAMTVLCTTSLAFYVRFLVGVFMTFSLPDRYLARI
jgi:hypothetical protein